MKTAWQWMQARAPELLIIVFLALLPLDEAMHAPVVVLLVVFWVQLFKRQIPLTAPLKGYLLCCLLLLIPMALSLTVAIEFHDLVQEIVRWSLYMLAGIAIIVWFQERLYAEVLVYGIAAVLLLWSFDALIQYGVGSNLLGFEYNGSRVTGVFHPNMRIGNMLAHWSPFLFEALRRYSAGRSTRAWVWLLVLPLIAVILLSGSRGAWLVMLVNLPLYALYLMYTKVIRWKLLLAAVATLVVSVAVVVQSSSQMTNRFQASLGFLTADVEQMNRASSGRIPIWQDGWGVFQNNPLLGVGVGNIHHHYPQVENYQGSVSSHIHLYGLDVLIFTGVVGFVFYLGFLAVNLGFWWRFSREGHHLAFISGLAVLLMSMPINVHWGFYTLRSGSLMILFLAMAFGVYSHYSAKRSETVPQIGP